MAPCALTILLVQLIVQIQADDFTLLDALQSNGYVQHKHQNVPMHA
jgi:hypothetical protein